MLELGESRGWHRSGDSRRCGRAKRPMRLMVMLHLLQTPHQFAQAAGLEQPMNLLPQDLKRETWTEVSLSSFSSMTEYDLQVVGTVQAQLQALNSRYRLED